MQRFLILLAFVICMCSTSEGQPLEKMLFPFEQGGMWGYMNYDQEIVVQPTYEIAYPTFGGLGRFMLDGKYGFVDLNGDVAVKPKYSKATDLGLFGTASVTKGKRQYTIDRDGQFLTGITAVCGTFLNACPCIKGGSVNEKLVHKDEDGSLRLLFKTRISVSDDTQFSIDTSEFAFDSIIPLGEELWVLLSEGKIALFRTWHIYSQERAMESLHWEYQDLRLFRCSVCQGGYDRAMGVRTPEGWRYSTRINDQNRFEFINDSVYTTISSMSKRIAKVERNGHQFYVDIEGNEYVAPEKQ